MSAGTAWEVYWVRRAAKVLVAAGVAEEEEERHYGVVMEKVFERYLGDAEGRCC